MDVLNDFEQIKLCTEYEIDGEKSDVFSPDLTEIEKVEPVYHTMPGWQEDVNECSSIDELPEPATNFLRFVQDYLGVELAILSTGPNREETIVVG